MHGSRNGEENDRLLCKSRWIVDASNESYVCVGLDKGGGEDGPAQWDNMSRNRGEWEVQVSHC